MIALRNRNAQITSHFHRGRLLSGRHSSHAGKNQCRYQLLHFHNLSLMLCDLAQRYQRFASFIKFGGVGI
jgi:hypothetical protein